MRFLIVEDDEDIRSAVARRLRADGHGVDEAEDLATADSFIATYSYDVVILDRMLPDGDGLDRLPVWRRDGPSNPVLFLTARDQVQDRVDGFQAGGDDYLVKPFAMEELAARVAALARRRDTTQPSRFEIADLHVDLGRREVRRDGVLLTLRAKEFALLELLISRAGQVVSKQEILQSLWGEDHEPLSNVEEAAVAALRRKLGKPPLIHTVRGAGYRLDAPEDLPESHRGPR